MIEQQQQRPYFKAIPPDPELSKLKEGSWIYKRKVNHLRCCMCPLLATKMLIQQGEGYKRIERYCDACASKVQIT